ncbi:type II toxin-antitoxin system RelE/ParE family toxin [Vulcanisaeta distributa]|uniref:type II toxin-antitoxin system RelE family toxin n=1 Tax=Vulcanisaeta distributa TaxID=164451 RepID=UPI0006D013D3|nr:type II toxin-antitoxin system RelE/ParE family toxin [Vulcanisaeta distributa]
MNSYRVEFSREAERSLRDLPNDVRDRILERINELANSPICEKELKGTLRGGLCRARVGDYRIIYQINHTQRIIR